MNVNLESGIGQALKKHMAILNVSSDFISNEFIAENFDKDALIKNHSIVGEIPLSIISVFYNEAANVIPFYLECCRLSRIFSVKEMIFVQNGSSDGTESLLHELAKVDKKIKVVTVEKNQGYGFGFKSGLRASTTDFVLLNHSDCQFDAYAFFTQHFRTIMQFNPELDVMLSVRWGRTVYARFRSTILRWVASFLLKQAATEFNGQPKLFLKSRVGNIETLPNDFGFDIGVAYRLLKHAERQFFLDGLELPRFDGKSSWSSAFSGQVKVVRQYIVGMLKFRKHKSS